MDKEKFFKKDSRKILLILLIINFIFALIGTHMHSTDNATPNAWDLISTIIMSACIYAWYVYDSYENGFKRPKWLNIAIIAMAIFSVPYYLYVSRQPEMRLNALFRLLKFFALMIATVFLGQAIYIALFT